MRRFAWMLVFSMLPACGDDAPPGLDAFLPPIPPPTGSPQQVFVGRITPENQAQEMIPGTAADARIGDWYLRNDKVKFVIQREGDRVISAAPYGGNIIDADFVQNPRGDRWGELGLIYSFGRTLDFDRAEVLADGARGGVAALRFRGKDAINSYINLKGFLGTLPPGRDPAVPLPILGAVTYILEPGADHVRVLWTLYNTSTTRVRQPMGTLCDAGSETVLLSAGHNFGSLGITQLLGAKPANVPYQVVAGDDIAYGLIPLLKDTDKYGLYGVEGLPVLLFNMTSSTDIFDSSKYGVSLEGHQGQTFEIAFSVAPDAAGIDAQAAALRGQPTQHIAGHVTAADGSPVAGATVTLYSGGTPGATLGDAALPWTFFRTDGDGSFAGDVLQGSYVAQARQTLDRASTVVAATESTEIQMPGLAHFDWVVVDDETGKPIPARITVLGASDAGVGDSRLGDPSEAVFGIVRTINGRFGTSTVRADADGTEPALDLVAGRSYRIIATRGPEWSMDMKVVSNVTAGPQAPLSFRLRHVVDTGGYVSTDFHQHAANSPDAFASREARIRSYLAEGLEFFASSDHDFLTDYTPEIESLRATSLLAQVIGVESTPFDWGHFGMFPLAIDPASSINGALDWAPDGVDLAPGDLFALYRQHGARVVQANHPRVSDGNDFQANWDRAALTFDFAAHTFYGNKMAQMFNNVDLRIPEEKSLFSPDFDAFELWNGQHVADTNGDGVLEDKRVDILMRDWFNFLSMGFRPVAVGNSDAHKAFSDVPSPQSFVRVSDDSTAALASGAVASDVLTTLTTTKDVIVTDAPIIRVESVEEPGKGIGAVAHPDSTGKAHLRIDVQSAEWAPFDTIEIFANQTYDTVGIAAIGSAPTALVPTMCFTARQNRMAQDTCDAAPLGGAQALVVTREAVGAYGRWHAVVTVEIDPAMIPQRQGAQGQDLWVVVRVHGSQALFPVIPYGVAAADNLDRLVAATDPEYFQLLVGKGVPAMAIANPIFIDVDGNGWRAPFAP